MCIKNTSKFYAIHSLLNTNFEVQGGGKVRLSTGRSCVRRVRRDSKHYTRLVRKSDGVLRVFLLFAYYEYNIIRGSMRIHIYVVMCTVLVARVEEMNGFGRAHGEHVLN